MYLSLVLCPSYRNVTHFTAQRGWHKIKWSVTHWKAPLKCYLLGSIVVTKLCSGFYFYLFFFFFRHYLRLPCSSTSPAWSKIHVFFLFIYLFFEHHCYCFIHFKRCLLKGHPQLSGWAHWRCFCNMVHHSIFKLCLYNSIVTDI